MFGVLPAVRTAVTVPKNGKLCQGNGAVGTSECARVLDYGTGNVSSLSD